MAGGFEEQLYVLTRGADGDPPVFAPKRHIVAQLKAKNLGIELKGFVLVVDKDTGQMKANGHGRPLGCLNTWLVNTWS